MKLDNLSIKLLLATITLSLAGCASGPKKPKIDLALDKTAQVEIIDASRYIPRRSIDEETGMLIPYTAMPNPYTQQKGRIKPQSVKRFVAARRAFQDGRYSQAKQQLDQLLEGDQTLSGPWILLGDIAQKEKKLDQAMKNYARAIEVNSANVNAYLRLAKLQRKQGLFLQAQNTYAKALSEWKDFPEAHLNLAILYDLYLNKSLLAQKHLEAYQFLTYGENLKAGKWLSEIQQRTGKPTTLHVEERKASSLEQS